MIILLWYGNDNKSYEIEIKFVKEYKLNIWNGFVYFTAWYILSWVYKSGNGLILNASFLM